VVSAICHHITKILAEHCPEARIEYRKQCEQKARDILSGSLGRLTHEAVEDFLNALDSDTDRAGGSKRLGRFHPLLSVPNRENIRKCDPKNLDALFSAVFRSEALDKVDVLRQGLKGVGNGLISSLLYLKNPDKYNIFLGTLSKGLLTVYPDKRSTFNYSRDQFDKNYSAFNDLVNRLRSECSLVPQQVDIVLTVLAEEAEETGSYCYARET